MLKTIIGILLGFVLFSAQAMDKAESFKMINGQLQNSNQADISVIVELHDLVSVNTPSSRSLLSSANMKAGLMKRLSSGGAREHKRFQHLPIMAMQVDAKGLQELENSPNVKKIYPNILRKHTLESSTKQVQADKTWERNYEGDGVTVAIVDSGFNRNAIGFDEKGKVVKEACFTTKVNIQGLQLNGNCWPNNTQMKIGKSAAAQTCNPCADGNMHGSSVAGVAAGYNPFSFYGVARKSSIIAVNVFSRVDNADFCRVDTRSKTSCVVALDSDILAGLDYVYSQRDQHDIAAVNLSIGGGAYQTACDSESVYTGIINKFKESNIAVVVAAGNEGSGRTISEPACVTNAIAVGSVDNTNNVSSFTNSNDLIDFWAPGEEITTVYGVVSYATLSGTSFAAPHVTGAVAILKSFNYRLTVDEITTALKVSGLPITDPLNNVTRPLIQIDNALNIAPGLPGILPVLYLLLFDKINQ